MWHFDRTRQAAKISFALAAVFMIMSFIAFALSDFGEILQYNYTNDVLGSIFTVLWFILSLCSLGIGIVLTCILHDAREELNIIEEKIRKLEKRE